MKNNKHLVWLDLEMTGLNPERDRIIEIATVVTDPDLNIVAEGPVLAISQPQTLLDIMDEWNTKQHNASGLVKRVQESHINEKEAERMTVDFLKVYLDKNHSPLCGNSVWQDRRFLTKYMPELADFFHYRNLDVSTLKELALRWRPQLMKGLKKSSKHLALEDVKDSIAELAYYREHFLILPEKDA